MNIRVATLHRDSTIQAVLQNLVEARVVALSEVQEVQTNLESMDWKDLLTNLLESYQLAESTGRPVKWYPVGEIGVN